MKRLLAAGSCWLGLLVGPANPARFASGADDVDERSQAAAARAILEKWQERNTRPVERHLHIVCWTPSDREFPSGHRERMSRMLLHIQAFYADQMERNGFRRGGIGLKLDAESRVALHEVRGKHEFAHYKRDSGSEIRKECVPELKRAGIDPDEETIAIFCNLATWDEKALRFTHRSPYYAGGSYRQGTAWQLDSPELDVANLPRTSPFIQDGEYGRISLGKHNSIFIGGMAHELGHALGLPHCRERPDEAPLGTALMGAGNRTYGDEMRGEGKGTFLTFAHAMRLASHPQFCGRMESRTERQPQVESALQDFTMTVDGKGIVAKGKLSGKPPVYGIAAYFDPDGNDDYNAASTTAVPDAEGQFRIRTDALEAGKTGLLRLVPLHVNGAAEGSPTMRFPYRVGVDGTPDLGTMSLRQVLAPLVEAIRRNDLDAARRLVPKIRIPEGRAVAAALLEAPPTRAPAEETRKRTPQSLTSFKADSAKVGWSRVTFNRIPEESILLESGGEIFPRGLYAHAPASHEYALGGRWAKLTGRVGLASGHAGSVRFTVRGDGRKLWESPVVEDGKTHPLDVDISGVQKLVLETDPTDDGASGDWGLWLNPELSPPAD